MSDQKRRQSKRMENEIEVCFSMQAGGELLDATVANLSTGGVFVATESDLAEGTLLTLRFTVSSRFQEIEATGKVVWKGVEHGKKGVGVQFVDIDQIELYDLMRGVKEGGWLYALGNFEE